MTWREFFIFAFFCFGVFLLRRSQPFPSLPSLPPLPSPPPRLAADGEAARFPRRIRRGRVRALQVPRGGPVVHHEPRDGMRAERRSGVRRRAVLRQPRGAPGRIAACATHCPPRREMCDNFISLPSQLGPNANTQNIKTGGVYLKEQGLK